MNFGLDSLYSFFFLSILVRSLQNPARAIHRYKQRKGIRMPIAGNCIPKIVYI